jgi:aspartokinase-like uncharacterized kinase
MRVPIQVAKLGGSLLAFEPWPARLRAWLAEQTSSHTVLVVGGGAVVESLRALHRRRPLADEAAHWLCVGAMSLTARFAAEVLPEIALVADYAKLRDRAGAAGVTLFDAGPFLREIEPALPGARLPTTWDVTSDSIAARLAVALAAERLVLLKSRAAPPGADLAELAAAGYVDPFLPRLAAELPPVQCVDLVVGG